MHTRWMSFIRSLVIIGLLAALIFGAVGVVPAYANIDASSFAAKVDFGTGIGPRGIAIGDLDGDGQPDLAVANYSSNTVSVLRNTSVIGTPAFAATVDFGTGTAPISVAIGDLDGDGKPDLAVTNRNSNTVSVLLNTSASGTLSFAATVDFTTGPLPFSVAIGDLDGNGKPDLAVANYNGNTVSVLRNTSVIGTPAFAAKVDFGTGSYPTGVTIGDLDGDGQPDLAVANWNLNASSTVSVFRNTSVSGAPAIAATVDFGTAMGPRSVAIGDLDGDGQPDLATANQSNHTVSVLRNTNLTATTIALGSSLNPSAVGQSVTFTATVLPVPDGGTVVFKDNGTNISGCETQALSGGVATCITSALAIGLRTITAEYSGTASYGASTGTLSGGQQVNCPAAVTVTTNSDSGANSLRQAIADVCAGGTITFDASLSSQTITLASGQLTITKNLTISGPGANLLTLSGNNASRLFYISAGYTVSISGLRLLNGHAPDGTLGSNGSNGSNGGNGDLGGDGSNGGAIYNAGTLSLQACTFEDNRSGLGGSGGNGGTGGNGSAGSNGSDNFDPLFGVGGDGGSGGSGGSGGKGGNGGRGGDGGAIYNAAGATLTMQNSFFSGNQTGNGGNGGDGGSGGNGGDGGNGGNGLYYGGFGGGGGWGGNGGSGGSGGSGGQGGAIYNAGALTLTQSTLGGNVGGNGGWGGGGGNGGGGGWGGSNGSGSEGSGDPGGDGWGGDGSDGSDGGDGGSGVAIYNVGTLALAQSTLGGNVGGSGGAEGYGGFGGAFAQDGASGVPGVGAIAGLYNAAGTTSVTNATVADNQVPQINHAAGSVTLVNTILKASGDNCAGIITNGGSNIDSSATCGFGSNNDSLSNTDPLLGDLDYHGGSTQNHSLQANSPAIDAGNAAACANALVNNLDQRGQARNDLRCDIGAYELKYADSPTVIRAVDNVALTTFGPALMGLQRDAGFTDPGTIIATKGTWNTLGAESIGAAWRITPTVTSGFSLTLQLCYTDAELGSLTEGNLRFWSSDGAAWTASATVPTFTLVNGYHCATLSGLDHLSNWTLATSEPTAVTVRDLTAQSSAPTPWLVAGLIVGALLVTFISATRLIKRKRVTSV